MKHFSNTIKALRKAQHVFLTAPQKHARNIKKIGDIILELLINLK